MSDFFVQSIEEVSSDGITIWYEFLHDNWRPSPQLPERAGRRSQERTKKKGGKWSNYSRRIKRNVVFFGIERVVPHSERSVSKSYRRSFKRAKDGGFEKEVCDIVGRILSKRYDKFWFREHSKYRLPHVQSKKMVYSGFNMGAGENALFEIMSTILAAPEGLLVVVDEIELGLHESAQRKFIEELKTLCDDRKIQVICTTHSPTILRSIPPEGRFYLDRHSRELVVVNGIAPEFAAGRLAEQNSRELDIFVEDGVSKQLVLSMLSTEERRRVSILPIGSAVAIIRQLSARYKANPDGECVALLDGDQKALKASHTKYFQGASESNVNDNESIEWLDERLGFLPGDSWPEWWILTTLSDYEIGDLAESFGVTENELQDLCEVAVRAEKHNEFRELSHQLSLPVNDVCSTICRWITDTVPEEFADARDLVTSHLD